MNHARVLLSLAGVLCAAAPSVARAQSGDTLASRLLSPGVQYRHILDPRGPWTMHVVRIDLRSAGVDVRNARAHDSLRSREKPTDMVRRATSAGAQVLVAVNADFFELKSGENENNQVVAGEWWKGVKVTESPYDTYDNPHIQFAMDAAGRPQMDRYILDATAWARGVATPIINVNANPSGNPEGTALFTSRFGATTPRDTTRQTAEAPLAAAGRRGDTLLFVRRGAASNASGTPIPAGGAVLSAYGAGLRTKEVLAMADGDTVRILLATLPRMARGGVPTMLIGGWPRILRNGSSVAADAPTVEGTISRNAEARHPRTAIGFSRDSSALLILTVDGRSEKSVGMTLAELATVMRTLGAWDAMNLDGGGSTTMVIGGAVVNKPSDPTGERDVGNALLVVKKR
ncbi:MAG: phosphodiester glycosidase family protein [Gemmatimonadota bacterium]